MFVYSRLGISLKCHDLIFQMLDLCQKRNRHTSKLENLQPLKNNVNPTNGSCKIKLYIPKFYISLLGSHLRFIPTPTFLGVTFDHTLSFSKRVSSLKAKFFPCLKALHCISAFSWDPSKESFSFLHKSFLQPLLTYASPRWFPFLSFTNITKLECLHQATSRAITGCLRPPYPTSSF